MKRRNNRMGKFVFVCLSPILTASLFGSDQSFQSALGPRFNPGIEAARIPPRKGLDSIHRWNQIAINATGLDHTPVAPGESRVFGEQLGPGRSSRAMAIVHVAIFDAVNAIAGRFKSYTGVGLSMHGPVPVDA